MVTDRCQIHLPTFDNREHEQGAHGGTSDISTHCIGYTQYRAAPKQDQVVGEIQLAESV